ncbi:RHS repeat-associated core domain-containing protein [Catellatospora coxensis]
MSAVKPKAAPTVKMEPFSSRPVLWPSAGSAEVAMPLSADGTRRLAGSANPGGLPVKVTPVDDTGDVLSRRVLADIDDPSDQVGKVRVEVLDRATADRAGVALALRLSRADGAGVAGRVRIDVDYTAFRDAYGADWDSRLKLVALPDCALQAPDCAAPVDLGSVNNARTGVLSAEVAVTTKSVAPTSAGSLAGSGDMVIALVAGEASSDTGDFSQTDLKPSYSWAAGAQSGDFTWSYPIGVPPTPGDLTPEVSLKYGSGMVDGQTAGTNVQPGWLGEGWSYSPGYIERSHRACKQDDGHTHHWATQTAWEADKCWRVQNARIMWNGRSTELIPGADGVWRLADDDATKVELISDSGTSITQNWNNERWKVTTLDGTQYFFGQSFVPGTTTRTNSVQGEKIIGNDTGEPCFSTTSVAASTCSVAYRWLLDYVVDRHGNSLLYHYTKEGNRQRIAGSTTATGPYDRSAYLNRIDYGLRAGSEATTTAPARVLFTPGDRCFTASCATHNNTNWPDTPWDLDCTAAPCGLANFWSTKRLQKIETQIWTGTGTTYTTVDKFDLGGSFPTTGNGTDPVLWLTGITRTGQGSGTHVEGGNIALPTVTFVGSAKLNRADYDPNGTMAAPMKYRIDRIDTETGGQILVTYEATDTGCQFGSAFPDPDNNTKRCFPQYYYPQQAPPGWSWWHKFIVKKVVEKDLVGGSPDVEHNYAYTTTGSSSAVLWHHDMAEVFSATIGYRTWGMWRGYSTVTTTTGPTSGTRSQTVTLYGRGMHADRTDAGNGTRVVNVTNSLSETRADDDYLAGRKLEETVLDGAGGQALTRTLWDYEGTKTGERTWNVTDLGGSAPTQSWRALNTRQRERTWLSASGTWRERPIVYSHDAYGQVATVEDQGDAAVGNDTVCTKTTYAYDTTKHLIAFPIREQAFKVGCAATPSYPSDALSETRNFYDNGTTYTTAPTTGNLTRVDVAKSFTGSTPDLITTSKAGYDSYGRTTWVKDGLDRQTTTEYTHTNGLLTATKVINAISPVGHDADTVIDAQRGLPITVTDPNDKVTTGRYDALGRLRKVWRPGHLTSGMPDAEYVYSVTKTATTHVQSLVLGPNGNQVPAFEIYDGLLRKRQSQTTAPNDGKRVVTDTIYDGRGLVAKASVYYNSASAPTSTLVTAADTAIDEQTRYIYDGAERETSAETWSLNVYKWKTTNVYQGDRVATVPPTGGTTVQDRTDVRGKVVEKRQFHVNGDLSGGYDSTSYGYNLRGELVAVTDPAGNDWSYSYNLLGWQNQSVDPDAGTTYKTYDNAGQLTSTTDARNQKLYYTYDNLGRKTEVRQDTPTGTLRASWVYDTVAKGQLTSATRHDGGLAYISSIGAYDDGYRPLSNTVTIPASTANGALAGTYTTTTAYKTNGAVDTVTMPGIGGLPEETVTTTYTDQGLPSTMIGDDSYVAATTYRWNGAVKQTRHGDYGKRLRIDRSFEASTSRLLVLQVDTETPGSPNTYDDRYTTSFGYDQAGNVAAIAGKTAGVRDQVECFQYDYLRRMTKAWTEASWACNTPQRTGADPYWREWTFDTVGNRLTQTEKDSVGGDTTWNYTHPTPGGAQPHTLTSVTASGPLASTPTRSFTYDAAGNTLTRTAETGDAQTLTWDPEGHLATLTQGADSTSYLYDAAGNRLIGRAPGKTTLYLGGTELELLTSGGSPLGTRYYSAHGQTVASRSAAGLTWTCSDHHGTQLVQIDPITLAATRNRTMPYGETRGVQGAFVGSKGFIGGTADASGLTHLGAREYDPSLGRFISVDPIMDLSDPQQWNAYVYSHNNPATFSDPTGLIECGDDKCLYTSTISRDGEYRIIEDKRSPDPKNHTKTKQKISKPASKSGTIKLVGNPSPSPTPPGPVYNCHGPGTCTGPGQSGSTYNCYDGACGESGGETKEEPTFWSDIAELGAGFTLGLAIGGVICNDPIACVLFGVEGAAAVAIFGVLVVAGGQMYRDIFGDGVTNPVLEPIKAIMEWF